MIIPVGFAQVAHHHQMIGTDKKGVVTYGVELQGVDFGENRVVTLHDLWETAYVPALPSTWSFVRTTLKYGPVSTGPTYEHLEPIQGGTTGDAAPPNVTTLVKKGTSFGGRANRGRFYPPGVAEANVGPSGQIASGYLSGQQTKWTDFLTALAAADMPMVILHSASSDPTPVTRLVLDEEAATQRRRLR